MSKSNIALIVFVVVCLLAVILTAVLTGGEDPIEIPEGTKNAVVIRYEKPSDGTVIATVVIKGDVSYAAVIGALNYDPSVLTYSSHEAIDCQSINNKEPGVIAFAQANSTNYTEDQILFKVTFTYTDAAETALSFTFNEGNFINDQFSDVEYTVFGADLSLS